MTSHKSWTGNHRLSLAGVIVLVFGMSLFSYELLDLPLLISDVALIGWLALGVLGGRKLVITAVGTFSLVWLFIGALGGIMLYVVRADVSLDHGAFLGSLLRAVAGVASVYLVGPAVRRIGVESIGKALLWTVRIHTYWLLVQHFVHALGEGVARASGLFGEPAWFSWFVGLSLFSIYQFTQTTRFKGLALHDFVSISVGTYYTGSFTGLVIVSVGLLLNLTPVVKAIPKRLPALQLALATTAVALVVPMVSSADVSIYWAQRIVRVVRGADSSTVDRLAGTIEAAGYIVSAAPLTGSGLGGSEILVAEALPGLKYKRVRAGDLHITFATAFATTGLLGGVFYALSVVALVKCRCSRWIGLGLTIAGFSYGGYLLGTLWWFMGLGAGLQTPGACTRVPVSPLAWNPTIAPRR